MAAALLTKKYKGMHIMSSFTNMTFFSTSPFELLTSCDIASEIIFVAIDLGPGQVPHVVQDPRRGCAGQGQKVVKGQVSGQTDTKFVGFSFVGWKKFKELFPVL